MLISVENFVFDRVDSLFTIYIEIRFFIIRKIEK